MYAVGCVGRERGEGVCWDHDNAVAIHRASCGSTARSCAAEEALVDVGT